MNDELFSHRRHPANMVIPAVSAKSDQLKTVHTTASSPHARGLFSVGAILSLIAWYIFSFLTLFMNKYTLDALKAEPFLFSTVQIVVSTVVGGVNMKYPCYMGQASTECLQRRPFSFYVHMFYVGITRFLVVFLSLLSLEYVAVSFTETVKSSAPLFTVIISFLILRERNGVYVLLSLVPIMTGLYLCSAYELSFTMIGFLAALGTNVVECLQFVLCKQSMNESAYKTTPAEFQFYSCFMSIFAQLPLCVLLMDYDLLRQTTALSMVWQLLNGIVYHIQSMAAWVLMEYISPVTHSVCNTVKRAIAIWLSVLVYGNQITFLGGIGTLLVIMGVFIYNKARHYEQQKLLLIAARTASLDNGVMRQII